VEFFLPRPDGSRLPVVMSARVLEDLEGREFTILTLTDISEQKRIEQQLRDANAQLAERQREIDFELSLAERVQQSLAPQSLRWGRALVETAYLPVRSIGGDFGMVVPDGDDNLTVMVCDVSGHGISSALIANRIYTEAVALLDRKTSLAVMLRRLNAFVLQHIRTTGFYFSMAAARLEDGGRRLTYAGAGHPPALLICARTCSTLMPQSAALGLLEDAVPEEAEERIDLNPGDRLVLYTDGITESFNPREEQFGLARLQQVMIEHRRSALSEVKDAILDRVQNWRNGPASDDSSLVLVEIA
jgi:serine phosphatase RsbU (regulator of sigma subunit)